MTNTNSGLTLNFGSSGSTYKINGVNTFTSTAIINQSAGDTLVVGNSAAFGAATLKFSNNGGQIQAGVDLTGANKINNPLVFSSTTSTETLVNSGTFGIEFGGTVDLGGGGATIASAVSAGSTFDGVISNDAAGGFGVTTTNSSLVTLKGINTYTGPTLISGTGKLSVSNIGNSGVAGNLGAGTTISLGSTMAAGTLVYTGTGETTSKIINLAGTTGGATIDQSGTGLLKFTGTNTSTGAGAKTLTLQGSTAGTGEISSAIVDSTSATSLTKAGTGTWTLSGASTYSGNTSITAGTLLAANITGSATGTGAVSIGAAGTLASGAGSTGIVSGLITTAGPASKIAPGATATANVGTVGALTLSGGLNIAAGATIPFDIGDSGNTDLIKITGGTFTGGTGNASVTFNFNNLGVTDQTQYALINFTGATASGVDLTDFTSTGVGGTFVFNGTELDFIAAVPEPTTLFGGALLVGALGWSQRRRLGGLAGLLPKA